MYEKALAALYEKKYGDAIKLLATDVAADERDIARSDSLRALLPRKYLNLGIAHAGKYEHAEAEQAYKKALALKSDLSAARILLGDTYKFTARLAEALEMYRMEAQRLYGIEDSTQKVLYSGVLGRIGIVYKTQGKLDSALVYYWQSLSIERRLQRPEAMGIQFLNTGLLFENRAEYGMAAAHFDSAYSLFSAVGSPYAENARNALLRVTDPFSQGHLYLSNDKPAEALAAYREALRSNPDSLKGYLFIANLFSQTGQPDSVVAYNRHALAKNSNYAEALNGLAWHYASRSKNLEEALALSQRSLQLKPQEPNYWDTLAEIYYRLARFTEAKNANDEARKYAKDENVIKSIEERARRIEAKLKEQAGK